MSIKSYHYPFLGKILTFQRTLLNKGTTSEKVLSKRVPTPQNSKEIRIVLGWFVFGLLGYIDATYLTIMHYRGAPLPCSIIEGCQVVAASGFAEILGIPLSLFGSLFYLSILLLAFAYIDFKKIFFTTLIYHLTRIGFIVSLFLTYLQVFVIRALCIYCLVSAVITTTLFILSIYERKIISPLATGTGKKKRPVLAFMFCLLAVFTFNLCTPDSDRMERRNNFNAHHENVKYMQPNRLGMQMFMNNLDVIDYIQFKVGGEVTYPERDELTFTLYDNCGAELYSTTVDLPSEDLDSPTSWKWIEVPVGQSVTYGQYYSFSVTTRYGNRTNAAKILINTNRYEHGRHFTAGERLTYPEKKEDIIFIINGRVESGKVHYPNPTTNIVCPERCLLVHDAEKTDYNPRNYFNIIIQERTTRGSFWEDYSHGTIDLLRDDILQLLEGTAELPGIRETVPYSEFYDNMNFYIAIEDPSNDPDGMRGFNYCANIDAGLQILTGSGTYGGGSFRGTVRRPAWDDHTWAPDARRIIIHELLGHGIGHLDDEYIRAGSAKTEHALFTLNSDEIGCPSWCDSYKNIATVERELISECWELGDTDCGSNPQCLYIGGITPPISYFAGKTCVPKEIVKYNIGLDCEGNSGCYIGSPWGTSDQAFLNVAQPNGAIMQSFHSLTPAAGFTTAIENKIRTLMNCMFPLTCHRYDYTLCESFQSLWDGTNPLNRKFTEFGNGCEAGGYYRRR